MFIQEQQLSSYRQQELRHNNSPLLLTTFVVYTPLDGGRVKDIQEAEERHLLSQSARKLLSFNTIFI